MTVSRQPLGQAMLASASYTPIYAAPLQPFNAVVTIYYMWLANMDSTDRVVTIRAGNQVTLDSTNNILAGISIPANTTILIEANEGILYMMPGWHIDGTCDAASQVTVTVGGDVNL